jgi:hypothetical protein
MIFGRIFLSLLLFFLLSISLFAQSDDLLDSDFDDLFDNPDDLITNETDGADDSSTVLEDLLNQKSLTVKANFTLKGGYSPGFSSLPLGFNSQEDSLILELKSALSLDFNLSRELRIYQTWSLSTPTLVLSAGEFFADYNPVPLVTFRAGRFGQTWGESKNFSHTNLIARLPENFTGSTNTLALRMTLPWKTGGIEFLSLTRMGSWENPTQPALQDFGWGIRINPPLDFVDLTLSGFAHPDLNMRGTLSLKTTLFDKLETYGEGLISLDKDLKAGRNYSDNVTADGNEDNPIDLSANLGVYTDFFQGRLSLGAEYFYNGEESELDTAGGKWDLYWGHNLAAYAGWKQGSWELFSYGRYNMNENTGLIGPGFNWFITDNTTMQLGSSWAWGDSGYAASNPDTLNRPVLAFLRFTMNGSWEKIFQP